MRLIKLTSFIFLFCSLIHIDALQLRSSDNNWDDPAGFKHYNWDDWYGNGAAFSPEYIAYIVKYLPIVQDTGANFIWLKGGTRGGADRNNIYNWEYAAVIYKNNAPQGSQCARGGYALAFRNPSLNQDITTPRVTACVSYPLPPWCGEPTAAFSCTPKDDAAAYMSASAFGMTPTITRSIPTKATPKTDPRALQQKNQTSIKKIKRDHEF